MPLKGTKNQKPLKDLTEKDVREMFVRDMEEAQAQSVLETQKSEFEAYLKAKLEARPDNEFFGSMYTKIKRGIELTENMVNALRKCMNQDKEREEAKNTAPTEIRTLTLKITKWLKNEIGINSLVITGTVKAESAKAWLIEGHADMPVDCSWCVNCGRPLTEPASIIARMGAICAAKLGRPYPVGLLALSDKEKQEYRIELLGVLKNQEFERWIPKSKAEILEDKTTKIKQKRTLAKEEMK